MAGSECRGGTVPPRALARATAGLVTADREVSPAGRRVRTDKLTANGTGHLEREVSSYERMPRGITLALGEA